MTTRLMASVTGLLQVGVIASTSVSEFELGVRVILPLCQQHLAGGRFCGYGTSPFEQDQCRA
jgi:hypothetical protein